jgi:hypothetical protein
VIPTELSLSESYALGHLDHIRINKILIDRAGVKGHRLVNCFAFLRPVIWLSVVKHTVLVTIASFSCFTSHVRGSCHRCHWSLLHVALIQVLDVKTVELRAHGNLTSISSLIDSVRLRHG